MGRLSYHPDDDPLLTSAFHRLRLDRAPEPWFGSPSRAKVFYLTLNPGHASDDDGTLGSGWRDFCYDMMLEKISRDRFLSEAPPSAVRWLRRAHGAYADVAFDQICNLRLLAYPSVDKSSFGELSSRFLELPTVQQTKWFVHRELVPRARRNELALLVLRGVEAWGFRPGREDIVDGSLFISRAVRGVSLTPGSRVGHIIDRCLGSSAAAIAPRIKRDRRPRHSSSTPVGGSLVDEAPDDTGMPLHPTLRGECTPGQIKWIEYRAPRARIRKLRPESCTFAMARRNSYIGGPRYRIFEFLDREPSLVEAIEFASQQGMKLTGSKAYWDIVEALKQGFIEIVDETNGHV
ncbi:hypothetical protein [Microvirga sesbaniae]|uniref:hypothetical protein n=1 Tax=Microvirga sesbaniae TaxID=681392 RepID=UPI0021C8E355|nr:hypothetical protein [Microvirga sp. HBU67692]